MPNGAKIAKYSMDAGIELDHVSPFSIVTLTFARFVEQNSPTFHSNMASTNLKGQYQVLK